MKYLKAIKLLIISAALLSCGQSQNSLGTQTNQDDGSGVSARFDTLVKVSDEDPGINCIIGGKKIEAGDDLNGNNKLDEAEIEKIVYACNGENGKDGEDGKAGIDGESCEVTSEEKDTDENTLITIQCGEKEKTVLVKKGDKGETGEKGDSCSVKSSTKDIIGNTVLTLSCGSKESIVTIEKGYKGDKGETGDQGAKGEKGERGDEGEKGDSCSISKTEKDGNGNSYIHFLCGKDKKIVPICLGEYTIIKNKCIIPRFKDFSKVKANTFIMGSPVTELGRNNDENQHSVSITRSFYIQVSEVTQAQWKSAGFKNPSYFTECGEQCPVENINWWEALEYANFRSKEMKLSECYLLSNCNGLKPGDGKVCKDLSPSADFNKDGKLDNSDYLSCNGYRLPTESEWEMAARAGSKAALFNGEITKSGKDSKDKDPKLDPIGWYGANSEVSYKGAFDCDNAWSYGSGKKCGTQKVKQKKANPLGLYDMNGNVWEWVFDWNGNYPSTKATDPTGAKNGTFKSARGCSWFDESSQCRSSSRGLGYPDSGNFLTGMRLVITANP